jgi:indole-3-glycerol phosphate synthase
MTRTSEGLLATILASKADEVAALRARTETPLERFAPRPLARRALRRSRDGARPLRLVTEIKRRSPSAGPLSTVLGPAERALAYARGGAAMISVLCDGPFFDGSFEHLAEARVALDGAGLPVPLLAKEFVVDPSQIAVAAASGADAVLLIARIVTPDVLKRLVRAALASSVEPLVEVATGDELAAALDTEAHLVGVNARDLDTLEMDADRAARVLAAVPADRVALHLSGIKDEADVRRVSRSRADAALIGEALMRVDDPGPLLGRFVSAAGG